MIKQLLLLAVVYLAWACLAVVRDFATRNLAETKYGTPENQQAQAVWHNAGAVMRVLLTAYISYLLFGLTLLAGLATLHLLGWWWLLFDTGYNLVTKKPLLYTGENARLDKLGDKLAERLKIEDDYVSLVFKVMVIMVSGLLIYLHQVVV